MVDADLGERGHYLGRVVVARDGGVAAEDAVIGGPGPDRSGRYASKGVKDPTYPDIRYVADLVNGATARLAAARLCCTDLG